MMKNIPKDTVIKLDELTENKPGQIISRTLAQNGAVSLTLFAFDTGEEISSHKSGGDALVTVMSGSADITVGETVHIVGAGESIVMPAGISHALKAREPFKMMLTVIF